MLEARAGGGAEDDARTLALSHGSRLILERLGVWPLLVAPTPILEINVSQRAGFGRVDLGASESGVPALGYVVEYGALQRALTAADVADVGTDAEDHALSPSPARPDAPRWRRAARR